jgi:hypothetical protein
MCFKPMPVVQFSGRIASPCDLVTADAEVENSTVEINILQ